MEVTVLGDLSGTRAETLIRQAVDLHYDGLSHRSFITGFGRNFLLGFYQAVLRDRRGFLVLAMEADQVLGFVLASVDSRRLMPVLFRKPLFFGRHILLRLLAHPSAIKKVIESLFYSRIEGVSIRAELLVIVVDERLRSKGLGGSLLKRLNEEFTKYGVDRYKVAVHEEMTRSNRFYENSGLTLARSFNFYGVRWNVYVATLLSHPGTINGPNESQNSVGKASIPRP